MLRCGPQHTFNSPHLPTLTFPYISPYPPPTPHHTFLHLLSYLFPHPSFLPPHPNTFSYYPYISLHLLKVWRSYHVTKFLWRSYHVAKLLATYFTKAVTRIEPKTSAALPNICCTPSTKLSRSCDNLAQSGA